MTREEIMRLAEEAGLLTTTGGYQVWMPDNLEAFAALVAAAEREACAALALTQKNNVNSYSFDRLALNSAFQDIFEAIRARGKE